MRKTHARRTDGAPGRDRPIRSDSVASLRSRYPLVAFSWNLPLHSSLDPQSGNRGAPARPAARPAIGGGHQDIFERNRDCGLHSVSFQLMLRADGRHRGQNGHSCLFFGKHGLVEHPDRRTSFEAGGRQSAMSRPPCEAIGRVFEIGFFASLYVSLRETHASNDAL